MLTVKKSPPARLPQSEMQMLHRLELGRMGGSSHMATMYVETMKTEPVWWGRREGHQKLFPVTVRWARESSCA